MKFIIFVKNYPNIILQNKPKKLKQGLIEKSSYKN